MSNKEKIIITKIEEVSDDSALLEQADISVCLEETEENIARVPPMWRNDIGHGNCAMCGTKVFFRASAAPPNAKKLCYHCAMDEIGDSENPIFLTRKSGADQLREYLKKKDQN